VQIIQICALPLMSREEPQPARAGDNGGCARYYPAHHDVW